eukprot:2316922-Amphidinium_carterae.1
MEPNWGCNEIHSVCSLVTSFRGMEVGKDKALCIQGLGELPLCQGVTSKEVLLLHMPNVCINNPHQSFIALSF